MASSSGQLEVITMLTAIEHKVNAKETQQLQSACSAAAVLQWFAQPPRNSPVEHLEVDVEGS
jgi:hypothetical protein